VLDKEKRDVIKPEQVLVAEGFNFGGICSSVWPRGNPAMRVHLAFSILFCCSLPGLAAAGGDFAGRLPDHSNPVLAQADSPLPVPAEPGSAGAEGETPPAAGDEDLMQPGPDEPSADPGDDGGSPDELSLGEIPVIQTMELTSDIAKRALDAYMLVKDKYQNSDIDQYENPQDFVDQTTDGKAFEADIKAAGFDSVNDWNLAITTLALTYTSAADDPTAEIQQQIGEIQADIELAQDMKDLMISSLKAMIPSENNKKVVAELMADPVYAEKLKELDIEEE